MTAGLTLGPLLYHWPAETWRDFYFRIADEAPVDGVYLGEVVCPKRTPFALPHIEAVLERLCAAGKQVLLSTPALIVEEHDVALVDDAVAVGDHLVEVNDVAALGRIGRRPHAIGPYVNVYNEGTLARLALGGAVRVTLPVELPVASIRSLAAEGCAEIEVQAFGRLPLAISARCYHARAYGRSKDACQYACGEDPDGLAVETLDREPFLAVNGVQTQSFAYGCLAAELSELAAAGVAWFRLSPQDVDMVVAARIFRDRLDGRTDGEAAHRAIADLAGPVPVANGYYHGREGVQYA